MSGGLIATVVTPHTPRMGIEAQAPDFVRGLIDGSREAGEALRALEPDVILLHSSHWVATFNWYVSAHETHEGICVAEEAPDLIPGEPYRHPGDPEFAHGMREAITAAGLPCGINESPHYRWDYATYVPLHYMDPAASIPLVTLPAVVCSTLDECMGVGRLAQQTAAAMGRRAVFVSSCALSHDVLRGPELWPTEERQALDRRLLELLCAGDVSQLIEWAPAYCSEAVAEMGGRPLASMIGAMDAMAQASGPLTGRQYGSYAQSSGSGNATVCITPSDSQ